MTHGAITDFDHGREFADAEFTSCGSEETDDRIPSVVTEGLEGYSVTLGIWWEVSDVPLERLDARLDIVSATIAFLLGNEAFEPIWLLTHE